MMRAAALILLVLCSASSLAMAKEFNTQILKISTQEQAVVVKTAAGELRLLKVGDVLEDKIQIKGFEDNHVILEGPGEWGPIRYIVDVSAGQMHISSMERRPLEMPVLRGGR